MGGGLHVETAQSSPAVIFRKAVGGLTSVILVVFGTVNLELQGLFVAISLRPVVAARVVGTAWSSCS